MAFVTLLIAVFRQSKRRATDFGSTDWNTERGRQLIRGTAPERHHALPQTEKTPPGMNLTQTIQAHISANTTSSLLNDM